MLNTKVRKRVATKCAKKMRKSVGKCSTQKCVNVCRDKKKPLSVGKCSIQK